MRTNLNNISGLLSNLKSKFGLEVSNFVVALVVHDKTGPVLVFSEPNLKVGFALHCRLTANAQKHASQW
jgi:hypothetical protein